MFSLRQPTNVSDVKSASKSWTKVVYYGHDKIGSWISSLNITSIETYVELQLSIVSYVVVEYASSIHG